jgi:hypothetical protein
VRIAGANGIATDGKGSIDRLLLELAERDHVVLDIPLPKRHWFSARWGGAPDGKVIAKHTRDGDIVVCHSFGAVRTWHAHQERDYAAIICIAPAMDHDIRWRYPERVHCLYSKRDWAVRVGSWLRCHVFGPAGNRGYTQDGVTNVEYDCGHSDYFSPALLPGVADYVERVARLSTQHGSR